MKECDQFLKSGVLVTQVPYRHMLSQLASGTLLGGSAFQGFPAASVRCWSSFHTVGQDVFGILFVSTMFSTKDFRLTGKATAQPFPMKHSAVMTNGPVLGSSGQKSAKWTVWTLFCSTLSIIIVFFLTFVLGVKHYCTKMVFQRKSLEESTTNLCHLDNTYSKNKVFLVRGT